MVNLEVSEEYFRTRRSKFAEKVVVEVFKSPAKMEKGKGLRDISAMVKEKIKAAQKTTYNEIADEMLLELKTDTNDKSAQETLKRRIYDVITVLSVVGYIEKSKNKRIEWVGNDASSSATAEVTRRRIRLESKRENFKYRVKMLLLYKCLIEMHRQQPRPRNAISLPIVIGRTVGDRLEVERRGPRELVISSGKDIPYTFSPLDVFHQMSFPDEIVRTVYDSTPELADFLRREGGMCL